MPELSTVSRNHAVIEGNENGWYLTDLGSTNGTFLNGRELRPQEPMPLAPGDRIRLAREEFVFEIR
jgi:pSer/pThr/pTyr-binding forkhead associated (FHA) protein